MDAASSNTPDTAAVAGAVTELLEAAHGLRIGAGYINGTDYDDWHVRASPDVLRALAAFAEHHGDAALAEKLDRLSRPMCMEPLDEVLSHRDMPRHFCTEPSLREGAPCVWHTPKHAADLGRCTYPEVKRICREPRAPGVDMCAEHDRLCRVVKRNGQVCGMPACRVPKHVAAARTSA